MTDYIQTLRNLVAAGEKATGGGPKGDVRVEHAHGDYDATNGKEPRAGWSARGNTPTNNFIEACFNARPDLTKALRRLEALETLERAAEEASDAADEDNYSSFGMKTMQAALKAAKEAK